MGRREAFDSPLFRSQFFNEAVLLDCKLDECFSVHPLGETEWLVGTALGISFTPERLGSDKTPAE